MAAKTPAEKIAALSAALRAEKHRSRKFEEALIQLQRQVMELERERDRWYAGYPGYN